MRPDVAVTGARDYAADTRSDRDQRKQGKNNKRCRQGDAGLGIDDGTALGSNASRGLMISLLAIVAPVHAVILG